MPNHIDSLFNGGADATGGAASAAAGGGSAEAGAGGADKGLEGAIEKAGGKAGGQQVENTEQGGATEEGASQDIGKGAGGEKGVTDKQANAAAERFQKILDDNGYMDLDELEADLVDGKTLKDLIGNRDAKKLIEDADTLDKYKRGWAAEELEQQRQNETLEEKAIRLEKENEKLKDNINNRERTNERTKVASESLRIFSDEVGKVMDKVAPDMGDESKEIAKLLLGVDNPMDDIDDISNARAVRPAATNLLKKFNKFVADIKQQAINEYADGKSNLKPVTQSDGKPVVESVKETPVVAKTDTSKTGFAKAGERLKAMLKSQMGA